MNRATFAVVGHPNKGKSSIVSTLSRSQQIAISPRSGTTTQAERVRVETKRSGYELIDTPGFQRPTKVLAWLKRRAGTADKRSEAVVQFVADAECQQRFPDEVELLTPLVKGSAILYVVDGSRPYGAEYEAEMEILRWTGQPSMALINPIENTDYVEEWRSALIQFFKTVRVFNPMKADFEKQIELLQTFAHLKIEWSKILNDIVEDLIEQRQNQLHQSVTILVRLLEDLCQYETRQKVMNKEQANALKPVLSQKFEHWMVNREKRSLEELLIIYSHEQTNLSFDRLNLPPELFDCEHWYMWGLNKTQLATVATITGATAGAAADFALAGHSFMLGAIGGGLLGLGSAWFGANKLVETKVKGLPLGGYEACYGPINNLNFPYVVIGRFIHIHLQVSQRNHAMRDELAISSSALTDKIENLEKSEKKALHQACQRLIQRKPVENLREIILPLFE